MYREQPPHTHNQILYTYGFHVLIKKKQTRTEKKGL